MPTIIKDVQQEEACVTIEKLLKEVEACNITITSKSPNFVIADKKVKVSVDSKYDRDVKTIIKKYRKDLVKKIQTLSEKYRIALDDTELNLISDNAVSASNDLPSAVEKSDGEELSSEI